MIQVFSFGKFKDQSGEIVNYLREILKGPNVGFLKLFFKDHKFNFKGFFKHIQIKDKKWFFKKKHLWTKQIFKD